MRDFCLVWKWSSGHSVLNTSYFRRTWYTCRCIHTVMIFLQFPDDYEWTVNWFRTILPSVKEVFMNNKSCYLHHLKAFPFFWRIISRTIYSDVFRYESGGISIFTIFVHNYHFEHKAIWIRTLSSNMWVWLFLAIHARRLATPDNKVLVIVRKHIMQVRQHVREKLEEMYWWIVR